MVKIAIAGSGGLAWIFAKALCSTEHTTIILSRNDQPEFAKLECQVVVLDYDSQLDLRFHLRGIDVVISTVSGAPQINLIDAAHDAGVTRFVPAEFEGPPARRALNDPLNRGKRETIARLKDWSHDTRNPMRFTIFSCGVFYQRFARGGLALYNIGIGTGIERQGAYLMNLGNDTAEVVEYTGDGKPIYICLTDVYDLANFIVAALDHGLSSWLPEFRVQSDRKTVTEILHYGAVVKNVNGLDTITHEAQNLKKNIDYASYQQDWDTVARFEELAATESGRYNFTQPNLNPLVNVVPTPFWDWLYHEWKS
ncbi:isoflavone reductase family protein-like protein [Amylocarpus encephaloides]|uniref:Isoflavone reductase family protein-like protein n=1 Tax=Amylocarpus encephaloides TaxID=45428 RepID=A0A9P8C6D2_9HELO|nr:isoflavone reductase family protein-like protein [Amylocarpus encephaloides]